MTRRLGDLPSAYIRAMCRASSTQARPLKRGMRQRLSAVPIAARSRSSSVAAAGDQFLGPPLVHRVRADQLVEHPAVGPLR